MSQKTKSTLKAFGITSRIFPGEAKKPSVLFDNHYPKGHHKHIGDHEMPYTFVSPEKLLEDFNRAVKEEAIYEDPGDPDKKS